MSDAIISIKPRHVDNILSGNKTVELRTRSINLPSGSRLWVYTTLPVGKVEMSKFEKAVAAIGHVEHILDQCRHDRGREALQVASMLLRAV